MSGGRVGQTGAVNTADGVSGVIDQMVATGRAQGDAGAVVEIAGVAVREPAGLYLERAAAALRPAATLEVGCASALSTPYICRGRLATTPAERSVMPTTQTQAQTRACADSKMSPKRRPTASSWIPARNDAHAIERSNPSPFHTETAIATPTNERDASVSIQPMSPVTNPPSVLMGSCHNARRSVDHGRLGVRNFDWYPVPAGQHHSAVAQLAEQWTVNPLVVGSSPTRGATF